mmetsp:Transcript_8741/g.19767  ORF Transcript_8741/g.19767 Transcript_8741/m.19767 type:complete len:115 (-) Transcript_8741:38-382(-)
MRSLRREGSCGGRNDLLLESIQRRRIQCLLLPHVLLPLSLGMHLILTANRVPRRNVMRPPIFVLLSDAMLVVELASTALGITVRHCGGQWAQLSHSQKVSARARRLSCLEPNSA